jgi:plastocyanin
MRRRPLIPLALLLCLLAAAPADAANRRVAIGDYRWSLPDVQIDLGEHVTWYFVGPDVSHSVTGTTPNAEQFDSDPQTELPRHDLGDTYSVTFTEPGRYLFQCKLHSAVSGSVTVSDTPGDPVTEVDPVPASRFDTRSPTIKDIRLGRKRFTGRLGTHLHLALDERARLEAEYYRLSDGRRKYVGYTPWKGHVGFNDLRFASRGEHFKARPGRYMALLSAEDRSSNRSRFHRVYFRIVR